MVSFISFTAPGRGKGGTRGAVTLQAPSRSGAGQGCSWAGLGLLMACRGREAQYGSQVGCKTQKSGEQKEEYCLSDASE